MAQIYYGVAVRHYPGCYRVKLNDPECFLQIRKGRREWLSEIRSSKTGKLIRYQGIYRTLRDAIDSVHHLLPEE